MTSRPIPCYIVDIDGTVAKITHRLHFIEQLPKDWDGFFEAAKDDVPIPHIIRLLCELKAGVGDRAAFIYVTGRPERTRTQTEHWLQWVHATIPGSGSFILPLPTQLYMRPDGDHREDWQVKICILHQLRADGYEPIMAFDARTQVVQMWRRNGVPCLQVTDGNY